MTPAPRKTVPTHKTESDLMMQFDIEPLETRCMLAAHGAGELDPRFGDGGLATQGHFQLDNRFDSPSYVASADGGSTKVVTDNLVAQFGSDGTLDTTFGQNGITNLLLHGFTQISNTTSKADGSLVIVGRLLGRAEFGVAHVLNDGSLNESFGDKGIVKTNYFGLGANGGTYASGVSVDATGNALVSFLRYGDVNSSYVAKFDGNGEVDSSFGNNGSIGLLSLGDVNVLNVSALNDGSFLTGYRDSSGQLAVMRYDADGTPDANFGTNGLVTHDVEMAYSVADIKEDAAGRIYFVTPTFEQLLIHRLNADGSLDTSFGTDGTAIAPILPFGDGEGSMQVALQDDGKILMAGKDADNQIAVTRLLESGRADRRFGRRGVAVFDLAESDDGSGRAVTVHDNGTVMVAGTARSVIGTNEYGNDIYEQDLALLSLSDRGRTHDSFSSDGVVVEGFQIEYPTSESGRQVGVQSDGKIIVGSHHYVTDSDFLVSRFLTNGQLDTSFGIDGFAVVDLGEREQFEDLVVTSDDKIVAMGSYQLVQGGDVSQMLAVRLNADGTVDNSFGTNGVVMVGVTDVNTYGVAVDQFTDGKIMLAGRSYSSGSQMIVAKLDTDGSFDMSFSGDGIAFAGSGSSQGVHDALAQPDGKVAILGYTSFPTSHTVLRLNADGSTDFGFGSGGRASISFTSGYDNPRGLAIQSDGKLVTVGGAGNNFGIGRLNANGTIDTTFGSFGRVTTDFGVYSSMAEGVTVQPDGKIIVLGNRDNGDEFIVARYTSNGILDSTFGTGGKASIDFESDNERAYAAVVVGDSIITVGFAGNNYTDMALAKLFTTSTVLADAYDDLYATE